MTDILLEIQGADTIAATEELSALPELTGTWETEGVTEREPVITTISDSLRLVGGTLAIAE